MHLLASKLVNFGHEVTVITLFPETNAYPADLPYPVINEGLFTNRFDKKYRLAFQRAIHKYENQFDIFLLWEPWLIQDAAIYRSFGGKTPIVTYLNNYSFCTNLSLLDADCCKNCGLREQLRHWPSNPVKKAVMLPVRTLEHCVDRFMLNHIDAFLAISPAVVDIYATHNIDREKMFIIPPVIDYEYLNKLRNNYVPETDSTKQYDILFIGRLTPEKGVDILIDAISRLESQLRLLIIGDGPHRKGLERLSEKVNVSDRVIFHGWLPYEKVIDLYLSSQLFVHPARWPEPFGRTVVDAMALRVPIIAADSGGPPWILQDTGLTFQPGNTEQLAKNISLLYNNPDLASDLVTKATERAQYFDYTNTVPKLLDLCTNLIETANKR